MTTSPLQIPPNSVTQAGAEFNYSVWTPGTIVQLCNVPWTNDYRDIVYYDTQAELDTYLTTGAGPIVTIPNMSYAKPGSPVNISLPFNAAYKYNYLRVTNPAQPIAGDAARTFYYFITDVRYVSPNTTQLQLQLDVWQTFCRDIEFGRCYVERGHIGVANQNANALNGREYLTVPEGLDTGNEYTVRQANGHKFSVQYVPPSVGGAVTEYASVIVVSTVDIEASGGTVDKPILNSADGSDIDRLPTGANIYFIPRYELTKLFRRLSSRPWISQGIIACYLVPPIHVDDIAGSPVTIDGEVIPGMKKIWDYPTQLDVTLLTGWRDQLKAHIPARYQHLTKFLTYPYAFLELTLHNGMPLVVKPECLTQPDFVVSMMRMIVPPNPRIMFFPLGYNDFGNGQYGIEGEYLDFATGITNLPQVPVVNNGYLSYMASNARSIEFQHQNADWSQQRALAGNNAAFDIATGQIGTNAQLNRQSVNAANESMLLANETALYQGGIRAAQGAVGGMAQGALGGGLAGAAVGGAVNIVGAAAQVAVTQNQNARQTAINNQLATSRTRASNEQVGLVRDTNKEFADWAARGDYSNTIAGINAKVQDARMIQPTISGQIGGEAFNYVVQEGYVIAVKMRMIDQAAMNVIGEFWLRYGYAINRFTSLTRAKLHVMTKFSYWRMKELYISSSSCPETFRQTIRGIFEKGVTVWRNPSDIATLDLADNAPLAGVTL